MKQFGLVGFTLSVALAVLMAGCQKSSEQVMEEIMSGKKHELPPKVTLATEPASVSVGEAVLKATVTDVDGRTLGEKARVRFLYWKAYEKVPSTPEEIVREERKNETPAQEAVEEKVSAEGNSVSAEAVSQDKPKRGRHKKE